MAGKIIADIIESAGSQITLNVGNVTILTASSTGLTLTPTNNVNINVANSSATFTTANVTGVATFSAGSNTAPSITASGDTNTGLYFPAADTIGFVEGGAEVMRINSSGFVGIGTTTPQRKLSIVGTDGATGQTDGNSRASLFLDNNGANYLSIFTGTSGDGGVFFSDNGNNNGGMVYETSSDALYFKANNAERMRIDSSGNVLVKSAAGLGYGTGSGGTVTQATNKGTGVTLNKPTGKITTSNAALASGATVSFSVTNSLCTADDLVLLSVGSGSSYTVTLQFVSGGVFNIRLTNTTGGSLSEAVAINFAIIKGATS